MLAKPRFFRRGGGGALYTHGTRALVQFAQPPGCLSHLTFLWAQSMQENDF
jgi:hypothetical protein